MVTLAHIYDAVLWKSVPANGFYLNSIQKFMIQMKHSVTVYHTKLMPFTALCGIKKKFVQCPPKKNTWGMIK